MNISPISLAFRKCKEEKRPALLTYTVAGYNTKKKSLEILNAISKHVDICEIGFPHNTPIADGGQIQTSAFRAIKNGIKMEDVFQIVKKFKKVPAKELWKKMLTRLFETGHPWITFKDACNVRSPQDHVGVVHSSNLCTEITLNTSQDETAVCNLGSVNLSKHVTLEGKLDKKLLEKTVNTAMRMLDNVIDLNLYPTKEARKSNLSHRPVGAGSMGWADVFHSYKINFSSDEAVKFSDEL